jgi:catecholate siderophore receptor
VPDYWLFDAMARYTVSESLTVKINLANLTDEYYFEQLHPWHVVPGASFTATFAVNYSFEP